jgi:type II secretory pathway pseudopilin PulG
MSKKKKNGFSLIEVNMAIFVMATAVLMVAGLYPMGLRESIQSQSDFKQVMFADYVLNVAVAAACSPNVTWNEWRNWADNWNVATAGEHGEIKGLNRHGSVPYFIWKALDGAIQNYSSFQNQGERTSPHIEDETYAVYCILVPGYSDQIMGIMVRSLDGDTQTKMNAAQRKRRLENQPLYYAEARFQGKL